MGLHVWRPRIWIRSLVRASGSVVSRGVKASLVVVFSRVLSRGSVGVNPSSSGLGLDVMVSSCCWRRRGGRMGPWTEERSRFR